MQIRGNTILITGGGSGIGRGLAEAFHAQGNQVVIAGRRKEVLDETVAANPGMKSALLDITDGQAVRSFAEKMIHDFPRLNVVIQNAGIMRPELLQKENVADAEAIVTVSSALQNVQRRNRRTLARDELCASVVTPPLEGPEAVELGIRKTNQIGAHQPQHPNARAGQP